MRKTNKPTAPAPDRKSVTPPKEPTNIIRFPIPKPPSRKNPTISSLL